MNKVAVFGIGKKFWQYRDEIFRDYEVVCLVDNDYNKHGERIHGLKVLSMEEMLLQEFEFVLVVANFYKMDIINGLREKGVPEEKIIPWFTKGGHLWTRKEIRAKVDGCYASFDDICFVCKHSSDFGVLEEIYLRNAYDFYIGNRSAIVIDVGMNIGLASLFFANMENVERVYSFEPFPEIYQQAISNFEMNKDRYRDKIISQNIGLSNFDGKKCCALDREFSSGAEILSDMKSDVGNIIIEVRQAGRVTSEIISAYPQKTMIMKVDAEGSEYNIFDSLEKYDVIDKIGVFMIETHLGRENEIKQKLGAHRFAYFAQCLSTEGHAMIYAINMRS